MATTPALTLCRLPISPRSAASSRLRESCGSWKFLAFLRKSSSGICWTRSMVMAPVSRPLCMGE